VYHLRCCIADHLAAYAALSSLGTVSTVDARVVVSLQIRAVWRFYVVSAGALPLPVSGKLKGLYRA
jgi:hypothetical protein